jgi:hypothetical protein
MDTVLPDQNFGGIRKSNALIWLMGDWEAKETRAKKQEPRNKSQEPRDERREARFEIWEKLYKVLSTMYQDGRTPRDSLKEDEKIERW